ncbi:hypothetical protein P3S67_012757 [Capsicum chacoense]
MDSFRIWLNALNNSVGKFLGQFKYLKKGKKKPKRTVSDFSWLSGVEKNHVFGDSIKDIDELIREVFLVFDDDKNGLIDAKELRRVLNSLGCVNCSVKDCRRMIKRVDKDGDGFFNFKEFKQIMAAGCNI